MTQRDSGPGEAEHTLPSFMWEPAADVAKAGVDGLDHGQPVVIPGTLNRLTAAVATVTPKALLVPVMSRFHPCLASLTSDRGRATLRSALPTRETKMGILDAFRVDGQVALVTGAGRGIGRATAIALGDAGADVALLGRTEADLVAVAATVEAAGRRALAIPLRRDGRRRHADSHRACRARAGAARHPGQQRRRVVPEAAARDLCSELREGLHLQRDHRLRDDQGCGPPMLGGGGGSVVNISSAAGRMAGRGFSAYGTAKAAMSHMSRITAMDLAPHIRVNAIAAGSVATDALASVLDPELRSTMEAHTPMRRLGTPQDIAAAVLYLCSPAGSYVTGKVLEVDGGIDHPTLALGIPDYEPPSERG
ncbi:MAG: SDR family oxidoreductase [Microthrixaceae bacterium]|nr:SDR family oxidoreductase [Microthrixaceae bacterium]